MFSLQSFPSDRKLPKEDIFFIYIFFFMYNIQHCFICRPSDSTVSEDAGIEPRTVATTALAVRRSNYSARSHLHSARSHPLHPVKTVPTCPCSQYHYFFFSQITYSSLHPDIYICSDYIFSINLFIPTASI
jgi:hypothetical protein